MLIKPASIGTPMPQHVKNYTDQEAKFPPPVYAPEEVARAILYAASHPRRDMFVGSSAATISLLSRVAPRLLDKVSEATLFKSQLGGRAPTRTDNLDEGQAEAKSRGAHLGSVVRPSVYTQASMHPVLAAALLGAVAIAGVAVSRAGAVAPASQHSGTVPVRAERHGPERRCRHGADRGGLLGAATIPIRCASFTQTCRRDLDH